MRGRRSSTRSAGDARLPSPHPRRAFPAPTSRIERRHLRAAGSVGLKKCPEEVRTRCPGAVGAPERGWAACPDPFRATARPGSACPDPFGQRRGPGAACPNPFRATARPGAACPNPFRATPRGSDTVAEAMPGEAPRSEHVDQPGGGTGNERGQVTPGISGRWEAGGHRVRRSGRRRLGGRRGAQLPGEEDGREGRRDLGRSRRREGVRSACPRAFWGFGLGQVRVSEGILGILRVNRHPAGPDSGSPERGRRRRPLPSWRPR
jgi:hypothetical protein